MEKLKDFLRPELIWFLIGVFLLVVELAAPGLIIAFFGIGAIVVAVVCLFTDISLNTQLLIFITASVLSLVFLRKWLKAIFTGHLKSKQDMAEDLKEFIGERAVVKERITPLRNGKIELHGTNWQARADAEIEPGAVVEVVEKDNLTLKVKSL